MESTAKPGRPRSANSKDAILAAAFVLLVERGYQGLSVDAVAQASSTGKSTIYRWWSGKAELAVDAFFKATEDALRFPDTGSARGDFLQQITEVANLLRGQRGQAMAAMLGGARTDPELARALGDRWLKPRREWGYARMSQAKAAGELLPGVEVSAALAILYGPIYAPLLFGQPVPDEVAVQDILAIAANGIFKPVRSA